MKNLLSTDRELASNSYYAKTAPEAAPLPVLEGSMDADVAIIGGGLVAGQAVNRLPAVAP